MELELELDLYNIVHMIEESIPDGSARPDVQVGWRWQAPKPLVLEVDFSSKTELDQAKDYILGTNGRIRTVIILDCAYHNLRERLRLLSSHGIKEDTIDKPSFKDLTVTILRATTVEAVAAEAPSTSSQPQVRNSASGNPQGNPRPHLEAVLSAHRVPVTPTPPTSTACLGLGLTLHDFDERLPRHVPVHVPLGDIYVLAEAAAAHQDLKDAQEAFAKANAAAHHGRNAEDHQNKTKLRNGKHAAAAAAAAVVQQKTAVLQTVSKAAGAAMHNHKQKRGAGSDNMFVGRGLGLGLSLGPHDGWKRFYSDWAAVPGGGATRLPPRIAYGPRLVRPGPGPAPGPVDWLGVMARRLAGWLSGLVFRRRF